jgi:hypothetical protein
LRLLAVGPSYETKPPKFIQDIESLIDAGDRRLTANSTGFEELVGIIPDIKALSEEELHQSRIKKVH